jgi:hypothetical protein
VVISLLSFVAICVGVTVVNVAPEKVPDVAAVVGPAVEVNEEKVAAEATYSMSSLMLPVPAPLFKNLNTAVAVFDNTAPVSVARKTAIKLPEESSINLFPLLLLKE